MAFDDREYEGFKKTVTDGLDGLLGAVRRLAATAAPPERQEVERLLARTDDAIRNLRGPAS